MELLGNVLWNLISVCLEIVLVSVQDWCAVCAKHNIGSEIVFDAPNVAPRCRGSIRNFFRSIWR
jgi:hypothetical protein